MDDHPYYLRQRLNTFPVVPVSTVSATIASSNIVRSQLPTVADLAGEQIQFPTIVMRSRQRIWYLYINLARLPQFLTKLLNRNCYRLSRVSRALA